MKKYISPAATVLEMHFDGMLALSRVNGGVADSSEVLTNSKGWSSDIWSDTEDSE